MAKDPSAALLHAATHRGPALIAATRRSPPLEQPSETDTDGCKQSSTDRGKHFCTQGRVGPNEGWEYEEGWSEASLGDNLQTEFPEPQTVVVKKDSSKRRGKPRTDEVVKEVWWGKKISANHPSQPQGFGIGEMLTGGHFRGRSDSRGG